jgi:hypothetical protein
MQKYLVNSTYSTNNSIVRISARSLLAKEKDTAVQRKAANAEGRLKMSMKREKIKRTALNKEKKQTDKSEGLYLQPP